MTITITCEAYQWQGDPGTIPQWVAPFMRASDLRKTSEDLILYTFDGRYELGTQKGEWLLRISGCLVVVATLPEAPVPTVIPSKPWVGIDHIFDAHAGVELAHFWSGAKRVPGERTWVMPLTEYQKLVGMP